MQREPSFEEIVPQGQIFISEESKYILIKAVKYESSVIRPIHILYDGDETSIGELAAKYRQRIRKMSIIADHSQIMLELENVGIIDPLMTIQKLKMELNNEAIKRLQFKPCFFPQNHYTTIDRYLPYRKSKFFQTFQKMVVWFKIPQFSLNVYAKLKANGSFQEQTVFKMVIFLLKSKKQFEIIRNSSNIRLDDLKPSDLQLKCLATNHKINIQNTIENELKLKRRLQLKFKNIKRKLSEAIYNTVIQIHKSIDKGEESLTTIETVQSDGQQQFFRQGWQQETHQRPQMLSNNQISRMYLNQVLGCKVSTILEQCGVQNGHNTGLSLCGKTLKPNDKINQILPRLEGVIEGSIKAYLVYNFQFFYRLFRHTPQPLDIRKVDGLQQKHFSLIKKYFQQYQQRFVKNFLQMRQIQYIILYTSVFVYQKLNKYLRQELQLFSLSQEQRSQAWQFKMTHNLIYILKKLPNYHGKVYRYCFEPQRFAVGQVVCFKFFVSTSTKQEQARKFCHQGGCCYIIESMSGKNIANYSLYNDQKQVLFMPFTHFQVLSVHTTLGLTTIHMRQLPTTRKTNSSLLLWVDDSPDEGTFIFKKIFVEHPHINLQIISLVDNHSLRAWIRNFGCLMLKKGRKTILVTDMYRKVNEEVVAEGVETISILRSFLPDASAFVYVRNVDKALQHLIGSVYEVGDSLRVGNDPMQVKHFIESHTLNTPQRAQNGPTNAGCQII